MPLHIIEPCGFVFDDKRLKRVAMDYYEAARIVRHASWEAFLDARQETLTGRLILLTTRATQAYVDFAFRPDDMLLLGQESAGVPDWVRNTADAGVTIPVQPGLRSLNLVQAASMVAGEALRQTRL
jgi:tRNA (cytidine/uridine-2'-O-)-methyltransferase